MLGFLFLVLVFILFHFNIIFLSFLSWVSVIFCSSYFLASLVNPDDFSSGVLHILWDFAYSIKENFMFDENISWGE